jgi:hypothetical protein
MRGPANRYGWPEENGHSSAAAELPRTSAPALMDLANADVHIKVPARALPAAGYPDVSRMPGDLLIMYSRAFSSTLGSRSEKWRLALPAVAPACRRASPAALTAADLGGTDRCARRARAVMPGQSRRFLPMPAATRRAGG